MASSRLRVWYCEFGSAVPSRVRPLIVQTQAESGAYFYGTPLQYPSLPYPTLLYPTLPISSTVSIRTVMYRRPSPDSIKSSNCITNGVHYRESAGKRLVVLKDSSKGSHQTGASFSGYLMDQWTN